MKLIIFILAIFLSANSMANTSIYDEINSIKQEGNPYESGKPLGFTYEDYVAMSSQQMHGFKGATDRLFAPAEFAGYGTNKNDRGLSELHEISSTGGSLENLRAENRQAEQEKMLINTFIGLVLFILILMLISLSRSGDKMKKSEVV